MRDDTTYIDAVIIGAGALFVGGAAAAAWAGRARRGAGESAHLAAFWDKWVNPAQPPGARDDAAARLSDVSRAVSNAREAMVEARRRDLEHALATDATEYPEQAAARRVVVETAARKLDDDADRYLNEAPCSRMERMWNLEESTRRDVVQRIIQELHRYESIRTEPYDMHSDAVYNTGLAVDLIELYERHRRR